MTKVSIIIAAYNEEDTIIEVLNRISCLSIDGVDLEVIVVDDGSTDSTPSLLSSNSILYTKLIRLTANSGKGAAVKAGLKAAGGDYVLFQDADLEYHPRFIPDLVVPIAENNADVVIGTRMAGGHMTRVHYFWHKIGNKFITLAFNALNNTTFTDIYSCYLLFKRDLLDPDLLKTTGWEQQAEILTKVVRADDSKRWYETPIAYSGRSYDEGKKIRAHHVLSVLWSIVRFRLTT